MRSALKVVLPVLLSCLTMSDVDIGGMAVQAEPSCQHSVTFCGCVTNGSTGTVWQDGIWCGSAC